MILEVEAHTGKVYLRLHACRTELLGVTDTRALENQRRRECTTADHDLLSCAEDSALLLVRVERLGRNSLDTDSTAILHNDLVNLCVTGEVQVAVLGTSGMDISVSRVTSTASVSVDPLKPMLCTMAGAKIFKVVDEGDALRVCGAEEVVLDGVAVVAERDLDGTLEAVNFGVNGVALVGLVLSHKRKKLLSGPTLGLEVIVCNRSISPTIL